MRWAAALLASLAIVPAPARAEPNSPAKPAVPGAAGDDNYLGRLTDAVKRRVDELVASHQPKLVPPVPVAVTWKPVKLGYLDLGAPLVAVAAADLDGDHKAELYAVTTRDVVAITLRSGKPVELGRVPFTGELAVPASRDPVGTAILDGNEIVAASSAWTKELRVTLVAPAGARPKWTGKLGARGFLRCANDRAQLVPGRNYFDDQTFAVRCRNDLVDAQGYPLHVRAVLAASTGKLAVTVERCDAAGASCQPAGSYTHKDVGTAFEIADLDHDGTPEIIASTSSAPHDADMARVIPLGSTAKTLPYTKDFTAGIVALPTADIDGDGIVEALAIVRFYGETKVDFWRLD